MTDVISKELGAIATHQGMNYALLDDSELNVYLQNNTIENRLVQFHPIEKSDGNIALSSALNFKFQTKLSFVAKIDKDDSQSIQNNILGDLIRKAGFFVRSLNQRGNGLLKGNPLTFTSDIDYHATDHVVLRYNVYLTLEVALTSCDGIN